MITVITTEKRRRMQQNSHDKYIRMTTLPVRSLVIHLAVPTVISMLVTALYNIADTYFISQTGSTEIVAGRMISL